MDAECEITLMWILQRKYLMISIGWCDRLVPLGNQVLPERMSIQIYVGIFRN